jgi:hypothetical protein
MAVQVTPRPLNRWPGESMAFGGVRAETVQTLRCSAVWWWQAMELDEQNPLLKRIVLFASPNPSPSPLTAVDRGGGSDVGQVLELDDQQLGAIGAGAAPTGLGGVAAQRDVDLARPCLAPRIAKDPSWKSRFACCCPCMEFVQSNSLI